MVAMGPGSGPGAPAGEPQQWGQAAAPGPAPAGESLVAVGLAWQPWLENPRNPGKPPAIPKGSRDGGGRAALPGEHLGTPSIASRQVPQASFSGVVAGWGASQKGSWQQGSQQESIILPGSGKLLGPGQLRA